jgi:hypothetical protein
MATEKRQVSQLTTLSLPINWEHQEKGNRDRNSCHEVEVFLLREKTQETALWTMRMAMFMLKKNLRLNSSLLVCPHPHPPSLSKTHCSIISSSRDAHDELFASWDDHCCTPDLDDYAVSRRGTWVQCQRLRCCHVVCWCHDSLDSNQQ